MQRIELAIYPLVVRLSLRLLSLLLAVSMSPGFVELIEDAAHLVVVGQSEHADPGHGCPEHGCTPASHHCGCCASLPMVPPSMTADLGAPAELGTPWLQDSERGGPQGFRTQLERPPIA